MDDRLGAAHTQQLAAVCGAATLSSSTQPRDLACVSETLIPAPMQVFTACCNSVTHGSNDVANAMGERWWSTAEACVPLGKAS